MRIFNSLSTDNEINLFRPIYCGISATLRSLKINNFIQNWSSSFPQDKTWQAWAEHDRSINFPLKSVHETEATKSFVVCKQFNSPVKNTPFLFPTLRGLCHRIRPEFLTTAKILDVFWVLASCCGRVGGYQRFAGNLIVFTALITHIVVFWAVTRCILASGYQHFDETCYLCLHGRSQYCENAVRLYRKVAVKVATQSHRGGGETEPSLGQWI